MSEVLFEITEDQLETGQRGYPTGYCPTSSVDPQKGLYYLNRPISELAGWEPMDVIYLLLNGKEGSLDEVKRFNDDLQGRAKCSSGGAQQIASLPKGAHPMNLLAMGLLVCGALEGKGDYHEDCLDLIAKIPEIAARVINHHAGWGETAPSRPELGYMENFTAMLNVPDGNRENLLEIFRLFNVLHYDHGGGNLSAFVGKAIASGLEDMYGSMSGAMCALAGKRHGGANRDALEFVQEVQKEAGSDVTEEHIGELIQKRLDNRQLVFGFGHAVLRAEDPRATLLFNLAKKKYADDPTVKISLLLREVGPKILGKNPKISNPNPNIDLISGALFCAAGFPYPEYFTVLFGLARVVGIATQIVYERLEARGGRGTPIIRPRYFFKPREVE